MATYSNQIEEGTSIKTVESTEKPTRVNEETKRYCLEMAVKIHAVAGFQMNDSVLDTYLKVLDLFVNKPSK
jgi:hypothetical protein